MSKADKIKKIVKGECAKPSFGTNPSDPWSAKAGLAESEATLLKKFLLSRGINPGFVPKDTKIAHSKSGEFKKWKMDHQNIGEEMTQEPSPTQKKLGDLKSSANKHKEIRTTAGTHEKLHKEETLDEVSSELLGRYKEKAKKSADELHSQEKYGKAADRQMNIMKATGKQIQHTTKAIAKSLNKEDAYQDSQAATQMPFDGGNDPSETPVSSKTAKVMAMVKKHKMVKEDLYDHEKDDKPAQTTKKPKVVQQQQDGYGRSTNDAAIVMTGGKTMTGETRDTIEIDPMLKKPKGGDLNPPNGSENKADNKKENK